MIKILGVGRSLAKGGNRKPFYLSHVEVPDVINMAAVKQGRKDPGMTRNRERSC